MRGCKLVESYKLRLNSCKVGPIAQSVEQRTFNPWVDGSSPSGPTEIFGINHVTHSHLLVQCKTREYNF